MGRECCRGRLSGWSGVLRKKADHVHSDGPVVQLSPFQYYGVAHNFLHVPIKALGVEDTGVLPCTLSPLTIMPCPGMAPLGCHPQPIPQQHRQRLDSFFLAHTGRNRLLLELLSVLPKPPIVLGDGGLRMRRIFAVARQLPASRPLQGKVPAVVCPPVELGRQLAFHLWLREEYIWMRTRLKPRMLSTSTPSRTPLIVGAEAQPMQGARRDPRSLKSVLSINLPAATVPSSGRYGPFQRYDLPGRPGHHSGARNVCIIESMWSPRLNPIAHFVFPTVNIAQASPTRDISVEAQLVGRVVRGPRESLSALDALFSALLSTSVWLIFRYHSVCQHCQRSVGSRNRTPSTSSLADPWSS